MIKSTPTEESREAPATDQDFSTSLTKTCLDLLSKWAINAENYWYPIGDNGCYGTGYNAWGVQTNQKYLSAMAVIADTTEDSNTADQARARALAALRFSLNSHVSGDGACTDGTQWGHTWISPLGIERMMHGVYLLQPHFTDEDHDNLRRMLTSEADWLLYHHCRGHHQGVFADPWNHTGKNVPESNLWVGALLWRTAMMYPDHAHADDWQAQAHRFLINAISVPQDAHDATTIARKPIKDRHVGANFFPNYALDHHGYLNVGYMVICLSNAAMLHFDMQAIGKPTPQSLYHHNADLWHVLRRMIFPNGRLARIGGDSRLRYTYCQEYLLPTLVYAADHLGETHAEDLIRAQLGLIQEEAAFNNATTMPRYAGSFYGRRLALLAESSPYYYTRLESDRACVLGMLVTYMRQTDTTKTTAQNTRTADTPFERSVKGSWSEHEHGAVLHRSPTRLASFAWRAYGLTQGLCLPPDAGHMAEWVQNLGGVVRFLGDAGVIPGGQTQHRAPITHTVHTYDGGFVTWGLVHEGVNLTLAEGWHGPRSHGSQPSEGKASAYHQLVFIALPDGHTVLGLQHCRTADYRTYIVEVKGLHLNLPNDLYNHFERRLVTDQGTMRLESPPAYDHVINLKSRWANVDERLGVIGLYGAEHLVVARSKSRRGGRYASLYVDELCFHHAIGPQAIAPNRVILDVGWAILSDVDSTQTRHFTQRAAVVAPPPGSQLDCPIRHIRVKGLDNHLYIALVNFGTSEQRYPIRSLLDSEDTARAYDLVTGEMITEGQPQLMLDPGQARVFVLNGRHSEAIREF